MAETIVKWFAAIVICLVLQTTLVPLMSIFGIQPDLIIIVLALMCLQYGMTAGIYAGFFLGLLLDIYSPSLLGQNALAKTVLGFFFGVFNEKVMRTDPIIKIVILIIGFLIHDLLFFGTQLFKYGDSLSHLFHEILTRTFPRAVYSTIIILLITFWNTSIKPNLKR